MSIPRGISPNELVRRLQPRFSPESFTEPFLVIDLGAEEATTVCGSVDRARELLRTLPCPTIGFGTAAGRLARALADDADVLIADETSLTAVCDTVRAAPCASAVFVQLLRMGGGLDIEGALVAESLAYSTLQAGPEFATWLAQRPARETPAADENPPLLVAREADRLHLTLNRPARRNAYSAAMRDALAEALELVIADATIRHVEWDGAGEAFCSGGDLDEFGSFPDPATAHRVRTARSPARLLAHCADRVTVRVHGPCIGAGIELPALAGRVISTPDAFFALPELGMGLVPGAGGTASLPRRIGRQRTAWLGLTGARIDAPTARDWGLVDEVAPRLGPGLAQPERASG